MGKSPSLSLGVSRLQRKRACNKQAALVSAGGLKGAELELGASVSPGPTGERQFCGGVLGRHPQGFQTAWVLDRWVRFQQAETTGKGTTGRITCEQRHRALQAQGHAQGISTVGIAGMRPKQWKDRAANID